MWRGALVPFFTRTFVFFPRPRFFFSFFLLGGLRGQAPALDSLTREWKLRFKNGASNSDSCSKSTPELSWRNFLGSKTPRSLYFGGSCQEGGLGDGEISQEFVGFLENVRQSSKSTNGLWQMGVFRPCWNL